MDRDKRKRPCDQCRLSYKYAYNRGEYDKHRKVSGISLHAGWANCCGEWIISFNDSGKLSWRRPYFNERIIR